MSFQISQARGAPQPLLAVALLIQRSLLAQNEVLRGGAGVLPETPLEVDAFSLPLTLHASVSVTQGVASIALRWHSLASTICWECTPVRTI